MPGEAARGDADMGLGRIVRAGAKIAGEADAVDDVAGVPARLQQDRQGGAGHRVHPVSGAFQRGNQRGANVAGGAEDGEVVGGNASSSGLPAVRC